MNESLQYQYQHLLESFVGYLPNFIAGLVLILIGVLLGWFVKRVVVQFAVLLRLERFLATIRGGEDFAKADVRYGFYNFIGNVAFVVVLIIFLDNAVNAWKLTLLSNLLERAIYFIPRMVLALITFGIGFLIASGTSRAVQRTLIRENVPRATLAARFVKAVLLVLFSAMALVELDIARQVVLIGFGTIFITLGALTVVIVALGGREYFQRSRGADG
jgi:hypothetical protein